MRAFKPASAGKCSGGRATPWDDRPTRTWARIPSPSFLLPGARGLLRPRRPGVSSSATTEVSCSAAAGSSPEATFGGLAPPPTTAAAVFFFRPRPPLVPLRVFFFGLGGSVPSPAGSSGDSSGSPRSGAGTWIRAAAGGATSSGSPVPFPAAAGAAAVFFLRPRPPREPLRVFFFGAAAGRPSVDGLAFDLGLVGVELVRLVGLLGLLVVFLELGIVELGGLGGGRRRRGRAAARRLLRLALGGDRFVGRQPPG